MRRLKKGSRPSMLTELQSWQSKAKHLGCSQLNRDIKSNLNFVSLILCHQRFGGGHDVLRLCTICLGAPCLLQNTWHAERLRASRTADNGLTQPHLTLGPKTQPFRIKYLFNLPFCLHSTLQPPFFSYTLLSSTPEEHVKMLISLKLLAIRVQIWAAGKKKSYFAVKVKQWKSCKRVFTAASPLCLQMKLVVLSGFSLLQIWHHFTH